MNAKILLLPLIAVVVTLPQRTRAQNEGTDRRISIEITTTENGNTSTKKIDLDNATEEEIEQALKELDVMDHFAVDGDDENVVIDIRRFGSHDDGDDQHVHMRMIPGPPLPPMPPIAGERTWLGVNTQEVTDEIAKEKQLGVKSGVYILEVIGDSPADAAGLEIGDVITNVDGGDIDDPKELATTIRSKEPGDTVKITYYRGRKKQNVEVELASRQAGSYAYGPGGSHPGVTPFGREGMWYSGEPRAFLGVTPGEDGDGNGAPIGSVEEGTAAEKMGLRSGDVITKVNGEEIEDFGDLAGKIGEMGPGENIDLTIERDGAIQQLSGELGQHEMSFNFGSPGQGEFDFDMDGMSEEDRMQLRREMDQLRNEMDKLREDLGRDLRKETRITIESRRLTPEEKALLEQKGVKGLDNEPQLGELRTFPNPSNGFFRIQFDVPVKGDLTVDVYDATGDRIYQEKITSFKGKYERTLDLSDKASGNYFLVIGQDGKAASRKLVKE